MSYKKYQTEQNDLQNEQWRPFPNYSQTRGKYFISDFGRYKSKWKSGKFYYSIGAKKCGYYTVTIYDQGQKIAEPYIHDLVAEAFYGPLRKNEVVHHRDRDKHNNRLQNLKIETSSQHAHHHNLGKKQSQQAKRKIGIANTPRKDPLTGRFLSKEELKKRQRRVKK